MNLSDEIIVRSAVLSDISFLITAIIEADKSGTNKSAYCSLLGISELKLRELLGNIFNHNLTGCEFSISSFCVLECNNQLVGACASWVECIDDIPSWQTRILGFREESSSECYKNMISKSDMVSNLLPPRTPLSLQIESVYIISDFRGRGLFNKMVNFHSQKALALFLNIQSTELLVYDNNLAALNSYLKIGYKIINSTKLNQHALLDIFPSDGMFLLSKNL